MAKKERILIVGGVAGGASCAARARRLSESPEIIMFDRGPYVSFAKIGSTNTRFAMPWWWAAATSVWR
jgi:NADH dehydrogenase FAD-containing subunit